MKAWFFAAGIHLYANAPWIVASMILGWTALNITRIVPEVLNLHWVIQLVIAIPLVIAPIVCFVKGMSWTGVFRWW